MEASVTDKTLNTSKDILINIQKVSTTFCKDILQFIYQNIRYKVCLFLEIVEEYPDLNIPGDFDYDAKKLDRKQFENQLNVFNRFN